MRIPTVAIGMTTYEDISSPIFARSVFEILQRTDVKLRPEFVNWHEPINVPVSSLDVWVEYWAQEAKIRVHGSSADTKLGGIWRRAHSVQSWGAVNHQELTPSTLSLSFRWKSKIDWWSLFSSLCELLNPAYGMLHLFTDAEKKQLEFGRFDGPVVGEGTFVNKLSGDGNIIKVDQRKRALPMQYKYLPELSWANYFGVEFAELLDVAKLGVAGGFTRVRDDCTVICISENLDDILNDFANFVAKRSELHSAFPQGTFRAPIN